MHPLLDFLPQIIDGGLGALGIGLVLKLRTLVDAVVKAQNRLIDRLDTMDDTVKRLDHRLSSTERHLAVAA
jgi:hypothetical protein